MKNVTATVSPDGKQLTLVVDLTQRLGPSTSKKTIIVGTSEGNQPVEGNEEIKFGLNVYVKA